tara:strand:- start:2796 stop:3629 length:834 start_codon:yes stop_codon:yes gene_type:complete
MGTRGLITLTKKEQDRIFAKLQAGNKEIIDIRAEKTKLNNPQINLSNNELFESHVRDLAWNPMQNHGLNDSSIELYAEDMDWPMQVKAYLNLVKDEDLSAKRIVDMGCGWGRGVHTLAKYRDANITGIDNNPQCIEYARQNYPQHRFLQDDRLCNYDGDHVFDYIISVCSAHLLFETGFFDKKYKGTILISDFFDRTSVNEFKDAVLKNYRIEEEIDQTQQTVSAMEYDLATIDARFKDKVPQESINIFRDIQQSRLHLFRMGANKQYKYKLYAKMD